MTLNFHFLIPSPFTCRSNCFVLDKRLGNRKAALGLRPRAAFPRPPSWQITHTYQSSLLDKRHHKSSFYLLGSQDGVLFLYFLGPHDTVLFFKTIHQLKKWNKRIVLKAIDWNSELLIKPGRRTGKKKHYDNKRSRCREQQKVNSYYLNRKLTIKGLF